jgi:hypothetical protein
VPLKHCVPDNSSKSAHWSDEEVERLLRLIESGSSMHDLARILHRSENDLEMQAHFLGVHIPQHGEMPILTRTSDSSTASATIHYAPFLQSARRAEA